MVRTLCSAGGGGGDTSTREYSAMRAVNVAVVALLGNAMEVYGGCGCKWSMEKPGDRWSGTTVRIVAFRAVPRRPDIVRTGILTVVLAALMTACGSSRRA